MPERELRLTLDEEPVYDTAIVSDDIPDIHTESAFAAPGSFVNSKRSKFFLKYFAKASRFAE